MIFRLFAAVVVLVAAVPSPVEANKRFALLIGNAAYSGPIGKLTNPLNDIALLEKTLMALGFAVTTVRNAKLGETSIAINKYTRLLGDAGDERLIHAAFKTWPVWP